MFSFIEKNILFKRIRLKWSSFRNKTLIKYFIDTDVCSIKNFHSSNMKIVAIQSSDYKVAKWCESSIQYGISLVGSKKSPILDPVFLLLLILNKKPDSFMFRYLNDYEGVARTILRFASEVLVIFICKVFKIKLWWLCHNVNQETVEFYPKFMKIRRFIIGKNSCAVFVTDNLLVEIAKSLLPIKDIPIYGLSFGEILSDLNLEKSYSGKNYSTFSVSPELHSIDNNIYGLSLGNWSQKKLGEIKLILNIAREAVRLNIPLQFIIAGGQVGYLRESLTELHRELEQTKRVEFVEGFASLEMLLKLYSIKFVVKYYSDYSVPLGLYHAISLGIPILSTESSFIGEMVKAYGLGMTVNDDLENLEMSLSRICDWKSCEFERFFQTHSWETAAITFNKAFTYHG